MGDAVNLASRLEELSEPGEILVGPDTYRLTEPLFEFEALEPILVKGKAEPVPVYRVLAARAVPAKVRGVAGLESPLVGREAEFGALQEAVQRLRAGVGGIVTIVGEAGIGKSRMVAELQSQVLSPTSEVRRDSTLDFGLRTSDYGPRTLNWVEGRCPSHGTSIAYLLWLDVLRGLLGVTPEDSPVAVRDRLWERVQSLRLGSEQALCPSPFQSIYPYLGRLMSLSLEDEVEATLRDLEGEQLKANTFRAVEMLIESAASERPLVLVCEDLNWADSTSIELLEQLLALTERASLLIICVFRPETEHGCWRIRETAVNLYRHRHTDLWLDPLSATESETLVGNLLRVEGLPQTLKECIRGHAEGNPFYVEEILRSLIDSGAIVRDEGTGRLQTMGEVGDIPIPDTLHGVLTARIDRLPEAPKGVLQLAAVIGRIFLCRVLAAIAATQNEDGLAVVAWEEGELDRHLLTLQREQMIRERARVPEPEYIFKHHLTREAAYNGLLKKDRRVFHRQVAETLERLYPDRMEEQVGLLAHHWERAEEPEKAIHYLLRAADRARRLGASLEAIAFYQLALQKATGLKTTADVFELHRIHERLGDVYLENLSQHDEALEHYMSFLSLAESEEDRARGDRKVAVVHLLRGDLTEAQEHYEEALARLSSLPPLPETGRVHSGLAYLLISRNQLDEAAKHARASLEISDSIQDTRGLADANKAMGNILYYRGELEAACGYFERSLALYRELGDLPRTAQGCNNVGDNYRRLGQMDRALEHLNEGLELARRIGDTRDEALLLYTTAELFLDQGRWEEAIAHLERALPLAQESGAAIVIIEAHRILGSAYQGVGQLEDARRHLETAETLSRDTQHLGFAPQIYLDLARLHVTQAKFDEARKYIQSALDASGPEPSDVFLGLMHHCYGYLHSRRSNWDDAVAYLEESLKSLERANLPAEVGKTRLSLGTAYANRGAEGDRGRACEQLLAALSIFRQIDARGYVAQVEERLKEVGWRP